MMSSSHLSQKEEYEKIIIEIDQSVTGLLKSTKDLLEALTNWSMQSNHKENIQIQNSFLQFHFDKVCQAFQAANMSMDDLNHIPHDLQQCLDAALSHGPDVLKQYLPSIRDTILQLLQGLKRKQALLQEKSPTSRSPMLESPSVTSNRTLKRDMTPSTSSSSELDMMDPNTQQAITQLCDDGNLAARSNIRRSNTMEPVNDTNLSSSINLSAVNTSSTTVIQPPARRRCGSPASSSQPILSKPRTPSPPPRRISTTPSSPTETTMTLPSHKKTVLRNNNIEESFVLFLKWRSRVKRVLVEKHLDTLGQVMELFRCHFKDAFNSTAIGTFDTRKIYLLDNDSNIMYELDDISLIQSNSLLCLGDIVTEDKEFAMMIQQELKTQFAQWIGSLNTTPPNTSKSPNGMEISHDNAALIQQQQNLMCRIRNNFDELQNTFMEHQQCSEILMNQLADYQQQERDQQDQKTHSIQHHLQEMGQSLTTRLETLQNTIDDMKQDVTQRRCRPSPSQLEDCHKESGVVQGMIRSLGDYLSQSKPTWKKNWEEQLQQIVGEQQCVKEYEHLVLDSEEDHSAIQVVLQHLTQVSELQKRQPHGGSKPPSVMMNFGGGGTEYDDEGGGRQGMGHVLQQLQTIDVDHQKRLDALAHAEERRARDMANRIDDFEKELITFVDTNKLKKTGGPEQLERQQQEKTKQLLMDLYEKNKST